MAKKKEEITPEIIEDHRIVEEDISSIMKNNYLDYAMTIIISRALPDVRDGLKPVHRRVLYSMKGLGLSSTGKKMKSAKIVGDTMGRFHPHGDSAIYETLVRMGQDFALRYMLVDPKGNFGSIDGDPAAAMRYTESRITPFAEELLRDIDKDTVDFISNYDGTEKEPVVLPSRFPNLLVNGISGIAVGMSTNIAPHNLNEIIGCIVAILKKKTISDEELLSLIEGPDFPTGGIIVGKEGIREAYLTGKGAVILCGRVHIEEPQANKPLQIVITEIPYGTSKPNLIEKIATLIRDNKIDGITDVRDESNREGMRIVVELKKEANPHDMIKFLYSKTTLRSTFGINNLALVERSPKVLSLREMIEYYIDFQRDIIVKRSRYELEKAKRKAHILEGLVIVTQDIDRAIQLIKSSKSAKEARTKLMAQYSLSEEQAQAVLDLRLQKLTSLEVTALQKELKDTLKEIQRLEKILSNKKAVDQVIIQELEEIVDKYGDSRRTMIVESESDLVYDHVVGKKLSITISKNGYIVSSESASKGKNGKTNNGMNLSKDDYIFENISCKTGDVLAVFTDDGKFYRLPTSDIPLSGIQPNGVPIHTLLGTDSTIRFVSYVPLSNEENMQLTFITKQGFIKKLLCSELPRSKSAIIKLNKDDSLLNAFVSKGEDEILLITQGGKNLRFSTNGVKPLGRAAAGVIAIKLDKNDQVMISHFIQPDSFLLVLTDQGYAKKIAIEEYKTQARGGKGTILSGLDKKKGSLKQVLLVNNSDHLLISSIKGTSIMVPVSELSSSERSLTGDKLFETLISDSIQHIAFIQGEKE